MTLSISIRTPSNALRLKLWGTPAMTADSYSTSVRLVLNPRTGQWEKKGQFSLIQVYQTDDLGYIGDMGANTTARNVTHEELLYIGSLQKADDYTVDQKMNWLLGGGDGKWGCPLRGTWDVTRGETWRDAKNVQMIGAVYAGQLVEAVEQKTFHNVVWQGKTEAAVPMWRIKTGTLQEVTAVDANDRPILPKGHVWLPLWYKAVPWVFSRWMVGV